jgi:hypothetical protein
LVWIEKRIEHWIRFGRVAQERIIDRRRRAVSFRANDVFGLVRWSSNCFGTVRSRIDIIRAIAPGEPYSTVPSVTPGGDLLLSIHGWPKVERVLRAVDAVEAIGVDACDAAPEHWCHVHNRLTAGFEPRVYSLDRHRAWLQRRDLRS